EDADAEGEPERSRKSNGNRRRASAGNRKRGDAAEAQPAAAANSGPAPDAEADELPEIVIKQDEAAPEAAPTSDAAGEDGDEAPSTDAPERPGKKAPPRPEQLRAVARTPAAAPEEPRPRQGIPGV